MKKLARLKKKGIVLDLRGKTEADKRKSRGVEASAC